MPPMFTPEGATFIDLTSDNGATYTNNNEDSNNSDSTNVL
jgi:hypothetical protein